MTDNEKQMIQATKTAAFNRVTRTVIGPDPNKIFPGQKLAIP